MSDDDKPLEGTVTKFRTPSSYTPEKHAIIVRALSRGHLMGTAIALARLPSKTVYEWLNKGQHNDVEPYRSFYLDVAEARAGAESRAVEGLWEIAQGGKLVRRSVRSGGRQGEEIVDEQFTPPDPRPLMFILERGFASGWGRRNTLDVVLDPIAAPDGEIDGATHSDAVLALAQRVKASLDRAVAESIAQDEDDVEDAELVEDPSPDDPTDEEPPE